MSSLAEWAVRCAATAAGLLSGYVAGRVHARARERQREREHVVAALSADKRPTWERHADEAEAAAVALARRGMPTSAQATLNIALQIRKAHEDDR